MSTVPGTYNDKRVAAAAQLRNVVAVAVIVIAIILNLIVIVIIIVIVIVIDTDVQCYTTIKKKNAHRPLTKISYFFSFNIGTYALEERLYNIRPTFVISNQSYVASREFVKLYLR